MDRGQPEQPERPYRGRRGGANRRVQVFYDQNDPYVALIVNVDWYGVQSLLANEVTRLAPFFPGLDAQVAAARRAAAQGAAEGAPEPEQELQPAEPAAGAAQEDELDAGEFTDVEVKPDNSPTAYPRHLVLSNRKKGIRPNKARWRRRWEQVTQLLQRPNSKRRQISRSKMSATSCLRLNLQPAAHRRSFRSPQAILLKPRSRQTTRPQSSASVS